MPTVDELEEIMRKHIYWRTYGGTVGFTAAAQEIYDIIQKEDSDD